MTFFVTIVDVESPTRIAAHELPDFLLGRGQHTFVTAEAQALTGRSDDAVRKGLERLAQARRIFSPSRGFYVVVPAEFRSWGVVPGAHFVDGMMRTLDRRYYVALLSAAEMHGAAHQAPQVFQVMVDRHVKDRDLGRVRLRFYTSRHAVEGAVEQRNVPTGRLRLSTCELGRRTAQAVQHVLGVALFDDHRRGRGRLAVRTEAEGVEGYAIVMGADGQLQRANLVDDVSIHRHAVGAREKR